MIYLFAGYGYGDFFLRDIELRTGHGCLDFHWMRANRAEPKLLHENQRNLRMATFVRANICAAKHTASLPRSNRGLASQYYPPDADESIHARLRRTRSSLTRRAGDRW